VPVLRHLRRDESRSRGTLCILRDTANDSSVSAVFGHPHAYLTDATLAEEARRRGWSILKGVLKL